MKILVINGSPKRDKSDTMQQLAIPMIPEEKYASTHNASL